MELSLTLRFLKWRRFIASSPVPRIERGKTTMRTYRGTDSGLGPGQRRRRWKSPTPHHTANRIPALICLYLWGKRSCRRSWLRCSLAFWPW